MKTLKKFLNEVRFKTGDEETRRKNAQNILKKFEKARKQMILMLGAIEDLENDQPGPGQGLSTMTLKAEKLLNGLLSDLKFMAK